MKNKQQYIREKFEKQMSLLRVIRSQLNVRELQPPVLTLQVHVFNLFLLEVNSYWCTKGPIFLCCLRLLSIVPKLDINCNDSGLYKVHVGAAYSPEYSLSPEYWGYIAHQIYHQMLYVCIAHENKETYIHMFYVAKKMNESLWCKHFVQCLFQ